MNEEELLERLRETFRMEAEERLESLSSGLLELEKTPSPEEQAPILEVAFREAHSLKGAARAVNLMEIETLCQSIEGIFADLKRGGELLTPEVFDTLHDSVKAVERFMKEESPRNKEDIQSLVCSLDEILESGAEEDKPEEEDDQRSESENQEKRRVDATDEDEPSGIGENDSKIVEQDEKWEPGEKNLPRKDEQRPLARDPGPVSSCAQGKPLISETIRISTAKLDVLLLEAEELTSLKLVWSQRLLNLRELLNSYEDWKKKWARIESEYRLLRNQLSNQSLEHEDGELNGPNSGNVSQVPVSISSLSGLMTFLGWNQDHIRSFGREIRHLTKAVEGDQRILSRMLDDLLDDMKKVMMLPFSTLFNILPRMVRDLARDQGKEAELFLEGGDIEIDRRILEEMKDPLIHLLRNAVDHGLEEPEVRMKSGKPSHGTIKLAIAQTESSKVEILFSDDGRGVDVGRIKRKAVQAGILSEKKASQINEQDALPLIFQSGISSSPIITEISGRGLGLAIVQEKVENLGGLLYIETASGKGSSFRIQLPVTLATFRGVLAQAGEEIFIVPVSHVERVLKIRWDEVKTVENRATVPLDGAVLPLADLAEILRLDVRNPDPNPDFLTVMVLGTGQKRVAFRVAKIICEQEVLVKSLGRQLSRVPNIAGATILGTGKVVPILNVHDLLKSPLRGDIRALPAEGDPSSGEQREAGHPKSVLIAEDSITSRMLIKNILEAAGYSVRTAVDGRDAYTMLKAEPADVVVSDVEMPRMNGFELTQSIRGNENLSETPVILVTSLDSREDKERGIDVGANAYIVKSDFDQSNLLKIIARLI